MARHRQPVPQLVLTEADHEEVWRVGYQPNPWAWAGWEWAGPDGRFHGRWDDYRGTFRTVYAGTTLLGCLLEVLAGFRPDPILIDELAGIDDDDEDYPTAPAGQVPYDWLEGRAAASATLTGTFCDVTAAETIAALRPEFVGVAYQLGEPDFDAAALKRSQPRELTQRVATHLHATTDAAGVRFASRYGDDLTLWAIFERAGDPPVSPHLSNRVTLPLTPEQPALLEAFRLHGLRWAPKR